MVGLIILEQLTANEYKKLQYFYGTVIFVINLIQKIEK